MLFADKINVKNVFIFEHLYIYEVGCLRLNVYTTTQFFYINAHSHMAGKLFYSDKAEIIDKDFHLQLKMTLVTEYKLCCAVFIGQFY